VKVTRFNPLPLASGYSRETIARNTRKLRHQEVPAQRALEIAFNEARRWFKRYNPGASLPLYLHATRNPINTLTRQGKQLYSAFMLRSPARSRKLNVPALPKVALAIGNVSRLYYVSKRDGVVTEYRHDFAIGSRPLLAVSHDGKHLMLLGGAYRFTHRGIVDKPR